MRVKSCAYSGTYCQTPGMSRVRQPSATEENFGLSRSSGAAARCPASQGCRLCGVHCRKQRRGLAQLRGVRVAPPPVFHPAAPEQYRCPYDGVALPASRSGPPCFGAPGVRTLRRRIRGNSHAVAGAAGVEVAVAIGVEIFRLRRPPTNQAIHLTTALCKHVSRPSFPSGLFAKCAWTVTACATIALKTARFSPAATAAVTAGPSAHFPPYSYNLLFSFAGKSWCPSPGPRVLAFRPGAFRTR